MSAPSRSASRAAASMSAMLPCRSPMVGFSCPMAMFSLLVILCSVLGGDYTAACLNTLRR